MNRNALPSEDDLSKEVTLELTEQGGHISFIYEHTPFKAKFGVKKDLLNFLNKNSNNYLQILEYLGITINKDLTKYGSKL